MLDKIARALRTEPAELLREPSLSAEVPPRGWRERTSASVVDVQRALLEAERLRDTARRRIEEDLAIVAEAHASLAETSASVAETSASVAEAEASYREQVAHLKDVRIVMDQVYRSELDLGRAYVKAMIEEGSSEGQQARRLRSASRKMVLFYEELVGLIKDAGVQVKRKDEGEAIEEPEAPARPRALELTVH